MKKPDILVIVTVLVFFVAGVVANMVVPGSYSAECCLLSLIAAFLIGIYAKLPTK